MAEPIEQRARRGISLWLRRADQITVAGLVVLGLGSLMASWIYRGGLRGRLIEIDRAPRQALDWQVDVNQADWAELTVLPDVGDQLAQRIVEDRQRRGPFRSPADLRRVPGLGPKTLSKIQPYLAPFDASENPDLK